jgi:hypothetical protein
LFSQLYDFFNGLLTVTGLAEVARTLAMAATARAIRLAAPLPMKVLLNLEHKEALVETAC